MVKIPGALPLTGRLTLFDRTPLYSTCIEVLLRPAVEKGTMALTWFPDAKTIGASAPSKRTRVPARDLVMYCPSGVS